MMQKVFLILLLVPLLFGQVSAIETTAQTGNRHIARNESLYGFFNVLSARLGKPVIVSKLASRKTVSGDFDLTHPQALLEKLTSQLGLIWYSDGQGIYIYNDSELRNAVVSLQRVTLAEFIKFFQNSGLYDPRYPLHGEANNDIFYVSGPPVFVDLVVKSASIMSQKNNDIDLGLQKIGIIHLKNTFVDDRSYHLRNQNIVIPGITTVIKKLLQDENQSLPNSLRDFSASQPADAMSMPEFPTPAQVKPLKIAEEKEGAAREDTNQLADKIKVIAYPDTNSLLVKGTAGQVSFIEKLVRTLDVAKRHIELTLWIIDLDKGDLSQLGTSWGGGMNLGDKITLSLNTAGAMSTLDSGRFLVSLQALERNKKATVISRPIVLTQENIPAIFDNNRTFYAKLIGERDVKLEHVTYGTLISVIPRISSDGEIEMSLNIEDGQQTSNNASADTDGLPEVGRTNISTVARVPEGKSLLIGGYTRNASIDNIQKIPLLGDIPLLGRIFKYNETNKSNTVRVFLIQPKVISTPLSPNADNMVDKLSQQAGITDDSLQKFVQSYINRKITGAK